MNKIQEKLLEIAKIYLKIVEELNLRYFAIGGTALGAVRHGGFIPWDDDIDFGMPRKDYEIFVEKAQALLPDGFFLQTKETDKNYYLPFCKIRNSNTTFIESGTEEFDINHGVWIDIFPMDGLPVSIKKRKFLQNIDFKLYKKRFLESKFSAKTKRARFTNFIVKLLIPSKKHAYYCAKKLTIKYDFDSSIYFWWNWGSRVKKNYKREWFDEFKLSKFEDTEVRVASEWDNYLTCQYGNWHEFPPENQRNGGHIISKIDLNKSYKDYLKF